MGSKINNEEGMLDLKEFIKYTFTKSFMLTILKRPLFLRKLGF